MLSIPQCDQAPAIAAAKDVQRSYVELKSRRNRKGSIDPPHCDGSKHVTVPESKHPSRLASGHQIDELLSAGRDLGRRFATRGSVPIELPRWARAVNFIGGQSFVFPIVDFFEKRGLLGAVKTRELGCAKCALHRA